MENLVEGISLLEKERIGRKSHFCIVRRNLKRKKKARVREKRRPKGGN